MNSLYRGYPIGSLLVWNTATDPEIARGDGPLAAGNVSLILDGQQSITTLYGVINAKPPKFFEGNSASLTLRSGRLIGMRTFWPAGGSCWIPCMKARRRRPA